MVPFFGPWIPCFQTPTIFYHCYSTRAFDIESNREDELQLKYHWVKLIELTNNGANNSIKAAMQMDLFYEKFDKKKDLISSYNIKIKKANTKNKSNRWIKCHFHWSRYMFTSDLIGLYAFPRYDLKLRRCKTTCGYCLLFVLEHKKIIKWGYKEGVFFFILFFLPSISFFISHTQEKRIKSFLLFFLHPNCMIQ